VIEHKQFGTRHKVTPLTEGAALFLNTFVGRTIVMSEKEYQSMRLEMPAHRCWIMGEDSVAPSWLQRVDE
jgi:hypothetical protein